MSPVDLGQVRWQLVILHALYVWVFGLAIVFVGSVFGFAASAFFLRLPILLVALAAIWAGQRVALQAGQQPKGHGLLVGVLVGLVGALFALVGRSLAPAELLAFTLYALGGLLGGRMAQRLQEGSER